MNNILKDLRIIVIKEDGSSDFIFSSNDQSNKNILYLNPSDSAEKILDYYESIKNKTYKKNNFNDKHLFYLKQYINNNNIDINDSNDDLMLYYNMSLLGNALLINSGEHNNIFIVPSKGVTEEQKNRFQDLCLIIPNNIKWEYAPNMHIETFKENDLTYGMLDIGETYLDTFNNIIENHNEKMKR